MERLIPEFPLRPGPQDPLANAGQRRRDDQGADQVRSFARHRLGDPAADVVTGDHGPVEPEFRDQPGDAAGLGRGRVLAGRIGPVLVRLAEPAQVRHDDIGRRRDQRHDVAVVSPVARPPVQQQHAASLAGSLVPKPEAVDRRCLLHTADYRVRWRPGTRARSGALTGATLKDIFR
jgi:hypothetical protein